MVGRDWEVVSAGGGFVTFGILLLLLSLGVCEELVELSELEGLFLADEVEFSVVLDEVDV